MRFAVRSSESMDRPVKFPSGRARLPASFANTGSPLKPNTTGIVPPARRTENTARVWATITFGFN